MCDLGTNDVGLSEGKQFVAFCFFWHVLSAEPSHHGRNHQIDNEKWRADYLDYRITTKNLTIVITSPPRHARNHDTISAQLAEARLTDKKPQHILACRVLRMSVRPVCGWTEGRLNYLQSSTVAASARTRTRTRCEHVFANQ